MTREEAIKELSVEYLGDSEKIKEAKRMAIKALEQRTCVTMKDLSDENLERFVGEMKKVRPQVIEQQPCEDAISREATIDAIYKKYIGGKDTIENAPINDLYADGLAEAVDAVWALPSVTPQPKIGRWIVQEGFDGDEYYDCSECGESFCLIDGTPADNLYNYCPNCGAKLTELKPS